MNNKTAGEGAMMGRRKVFNNNIFRPQETRKSTNTTYNVHIKTSLPICQKINNKSYRKITFQKKVNNDVKGK